MVRKCSHALTREFLRTSRTQARAGTFSGVTGGRALSFHDLSVGEAPAPLPQEAENGGGGKFPSQISHRKEQPGRLGTEEKVPRPSHECPHVNTFERYSLFSPEGEKRWVPNWN